MNKKENGKTLSQLERTNEAAKKAVAGGLEDAVSWAGAELQGFSMRLTEEETLMTMRVIMSGEARVCFVASGTMAQCFAKAVREAKKDKLVFKTDRYAKNGA